MGLDLSLLPFDADHEGLAFSHTVLDCERRRVLFDQILAIEKAHGRDVPERFTSYLSRDDKYEDTHYGVTKDTPYGEPLKYVTAGQLVPLESRPEVEDCKNRAVWAYLGALDDPQTKIALYWH